MVKLKIAPAVTASTRLTPMGHQPQSPNHLLPQGWAGEMDSRTGRVKGGGAGVTRSLARHAGQLGSCGGGGGGSDDNETDIITQ